MITVEYWDYVHMRYVRILKKPEDIYVISPYTPNIVGGVGRTDILSLFERIRDLECELESEQEAHKETMDRLLENM